MVACGYCTTRRKAKVVVRPAVAVDGSEASQEATEASQVETAGSQEETEASREATEEFWEARVAARLETVGATTEATLTVAAVLHLRGQMGCQKPGLAEAQRLRRWRRLWVLIEAQM